MGIGPAGCRGADARHPCRRWATRFAPNRWRSRSLTGTNSPFFASLTNAQREALITLRSQNNGATLAMVAGRYRWPSTAICVPRLAHGSL
ncbi:hypothetical protein AB9K28_11675 [Enterobacter asburiae]